MSREWCVATRRFMADALSGCRLTIALQTRAARHTQRFMDLREIRAEARLLHSNMRSD
jgi:hypothetical protein